MLFSSGGNHFRAFQRILGGAIRFLTRGVNLLRAPDDEGQVAPHLVEVLDDGFAFFGFGLDRGRGLIDSRRDGLDLFLNLLDQILNFLGALFRGFGQGAHFIGDYRKALTVLTGASGFDGGV